MGLLSRDRPRGFETVGDMVRSLGLVLVLVALFMLGLPRPHREAVTVVDYSLELAQARRAAPYPVLAPSGLSPRWRATSVRLSGEGGATRWHLGFVTPDDEYAALEQSNEGGDFEARMTAAGAPDGTSSVAGRGWERRLRTSKEQRSLVLRSGGVVTIVTGTASYAELEALAASLHS